MCFISFAELDLALFIFQISSNVSSPLWRHDRGCEWREGVKHQGSFHRFWLFVSSHAGQGQNVFYPLQNCNGDREARSTGCSPGSDYSGTRWSSLRHSPPLFLSFINFACLTVTRCDNEAPPLEIYSSACCVRCGSLLVNCL